MLKTEIDILEQRNADYRPVFFYLNKKIDRISLEKLVAAGDIFVFDELHSQVKELMKSRNVALQLTNEQCSELAQKHIGDNPDEYGVWVYYPWSSKVVHLLDKEEFIELRTSRNQYKITREEQEFLATKTIGIIGLSVGQSIALTIAMERTCGRLRLADMDTIDLSNLNRLRTGVSNIGLKKTIVAAREIMELDPYLDVALYSDGITKDNMNDFFTKDGKLDLLVEVCDGIDIKILSRFKARELQIPVVMDTNDRGMLDVERFDLEPQRPLLHGLAAGLEPGTIEQMTPQEKMPVILKIVGADTLSSRMKRSMGELGKTISTWPQLASSVVLGGAMTTDVCRRIFLNEFKDSGRYYIDFDELIRNNL